MIEQEVNNLANSLGFHRLKDGAVVQVIVDGEPLEIRKTKGEIATHKGEASDPDINISMTESAFSNIKNSDNPIESIKMEYDEGNVTIEPKKGMIQLGLKGYKSLYDLLK